MNIVYKNTDLEISNVCFDSRRVTDGALFVAMRGVSIDGHQYIKTAVENGAKVVVCEELPAENNEAVTFIKVENSAIALSEIASLYYHNPSSKLKLVGVTGTNGKTTTATLLYDIFTGLGYKVGLISTVVYKIGEREFPASHTTPDSLKINELMAMMVEEGCSYCFMEVSSHSIHQHRIDGLQFDGAIFSNITHDHLDYHGSFAEYIKAKKMFFDKLPSSAFAIYNSDDRNGQIMVQNCKATLRSYGLRSSADYKCKIIEAHMGSMLLRLDNREVWVGLIGKFNAYNLTSVYAAVCELGVDQDVALRAISLLKSVVGRFDYIVSADGITAIVDYAHTPDALENVLKTIEEIRDPSQRIITVVGCGGNRDKSKRPEMAKIAADLSDFTILTSDNPRFEEPEAILEDMSFVLKRDNIYNGKYIVITDRKQAIAASVAMAKGVTAEKRAKAVMGDIILIAGKGHEPYQEVKGVRNYFNDKEEVEGIFSKRV